MNDGNFDISAEIQCLGEPYICIDDEPYTTMNEEIAWYVVRNSLLEQLSHSLCDHSN